MTTLLAVLIVTGSLAALLNGLFGLGLGRSDAAGNGLALAYVVVATLGTALLVVAALLLAWLLAAPSAEAPSVTATMLGGVVLASALPFVLLRVQAANATARARRNLLAGLGTAAWLGLLLHAASRGLAWPLPAALAGLGAFVPAAAAIVVALAPIARGDARRRAGRAHASPFAIAFPALVLRDGEAVFVVREATALAALDPQVFTRSPPASTIDADGNVWWLQPADQLADWPTRREPAPCPVAVLRDRVLALPQLHHDPSQDAAIRRLVALQENVTALSFVLPREADPDGVAPDQGEASRRS